MNDARSRRLRFAVGFAALVMAVEVIGLLAGGTVNQLRSSLPGIDKALHAIGFFAIAVVSRRLMAAYLPDFRRGPELLAAALIALIVVDEFGQSLNASRDVDPKDALAGLGGLVAGLVVAMPGRRSAWATGAAIAAAGLAIYITFDAYTLQVHLNAGRQLERQGDFVGARREFRRALDAGLRTPSLFNELGWVEIESGVGNAQTAVEFAAQALKARPNNADYQDTYGWALHHAGRSAEALPYLQHAYATKPDIFNIHYHLGEVYAALGQHDRAAFHFRRQIELTDTREAARAAAALKRLESRLRSQAADDLPSTARRPIQLQHG